MIDEKYVKLTAKLYEMRDSAKMLLGDKYKAHMADLGEIIKTMAIRQRKPYLECVIDHCKKKELQGMELIFTMAAAVELAEPSA